jgi:Skp family chaperone for outer membrane proteins
MKFRMSVAGAAILLASLVVSNANAASDRDSMKKGSAKKSSSCCTDVQNQIDALRQELQGQIDSLKSDLAAKDAALKQAQQAAADAQAAAAKAEADAQAQQAAFSENSAAVASLQGSVKDLGANQASLATTLSDETTGIKKLIANPDQINYKGITLSPAGSFVAAETVWRSAATASDINTSFTGIPLQHAEAAQLTEFYASARQSRIALKATGKLPSLTATGYYEADFLGTGVTSNNNQSNSYVLRQREIWGDAKLNSGWDFSGGTGWSLATEGTSGLARGTQITPATIDAQYTAGFVWARQDSFRVSKNIGSKFFIGASAENPQTLNPGGNNLPINELIGSTGTPGGLFNGSAAPIAGTAIANYTFNYAPDFILKAAIEPGWGHWELFGIQRTFRDRIYPNLTCSTAGTPAVTTCTGSTAGAWNDTQIGAGIGGGFRGDIVPKVVTIGLKGLWGQGIGRYGDSTIADVTIRPDGQLSPIHGFSALSTVELNPNPKLNIYFNYGGDYLDRDYVLNAAGTQVGYGNRSAAMSSCDVEPNPGNGGVNQASAPTGAGGSCAGNNKDVQEFTAGYWFYFFNNPHGRLRQGIQYSYIRRDLWSGATSTANPGAGAYGDDNMVFTSFRYYLP